MDGTTGGFDLSSLTGLLTGGGIIGLVFLAVLTWVLFRFFFQD